MRLNDDEKRAVALAERLLRESGRRMWHCSLCAANVEAVDDFGRCPACQAQSEKVRVKLEARKAAKRATEGNR